MHLGRTARLVGLSVLACVLGGAVWWADRPGPVVPSPTAAARHGAGPPAAPVAAASAVPAVEVLRRWDARRASAYAAGDVRALRGLYLPGAGTTDVAVLREYLRRGFRVEGMRMQLLAVRVLDATPSRVRLRVTDRLAGAVSVRAGERRALPRDTASTRVVELSRRGPGQVWRVASVVPP